MENNKLESYLQGVAVQQYKSDIGFRTLVESVNDNMYIIPKYQRKYRWKKEQVVSLVESLLRGLPIPPIYTCRNENNQLEILDGQQRVMSLFFYYIGYFLNKKQESAINFSEIDTQNCSFAEALISQFQVEKLHIDLKDANGEKFNADYAALPIEIKRKVDYTAITVIEIKIGYMCKFYDMLHEFNKNNAKWRKLWGREDAKDRDMETLLRFCALKGNVEIVINKDENKYEFEIKGYYSSYAELLDRFSMEAAGFSDGEIEKYKTSLERFVNLFEVNNVLSSKVALMEGFYIIFEKLGIRRKITNEMLDNVQKADDYKNNSGQRTVNIKKMNGRWNAVYEIWTGFDKGNC